MHHYSKVADDLMCLSRQGSFSGSIGVRFPKAAVAASAEQWTPPQMNIAIEGSDLHKKEKGGKWMRPPEKIPTHRSYQSTFFFIWPLIGKNEG